MPLPERACCLWWLAVADAALQANVTTIQPGKMYCTSITTLSSEAPVISWKNDDAYYAPLWPILPGRKQLVNIIFTRPIPKSLEPVQYEWIKPNTTLVDGGKNYDKIARFTFHKSEMRKPSCPLFFSPPPSLTQTTSDEPPPPPISLEEKTE